MLQDLYSLVSGLPRGSPKMDRLNLQGHQRNVSVHCEINLCIGALQYHALIVPKNGFKSLHSDQGCCRAHMTSAGQRSATRTWRHHIM